MAGRDYTREPWGTGREAVIGALVGVAGAIGAALWVGGQVASVVTGHGWAGGTVLSGIAAVGRPTEPDRAWGSVMPGPALYWPITLVIAVALLTGAVRLLMLAVRRWRDRTPPVTRLSSRPGMATHREVRDRMGSGALAARAASLRPAVTDAAVDGVFRPEDFGWCWPLGAGGTEPRR